MKWSAAGRSLIRFGVFELDPESGELRKSGVLIHLRPQSVRILALLASRPGQLVTREELCRHVWGSETFVDADQGLNHCIKRIRTALGDDAEVPRYIQTLPQHGYRFIAPLEERERPAQSGAAVPRRLWLMLAGAILVALVSGCTLWLLSRPGKAPAAAALPIPLTAHPGFEGSPSFSPEGDRVAFHWNGPKQDNFDIYVKLIGAGEPVRLTTDPAPDAHPAWSPDGRWIAFQRELSDEKSGVFLIPAVGGAERKLTEVREERGGALYGVGRMSWHPGGKWLVIPERNSAHEPFALSLVSVETGEKRRLTSPPKDLLLGDVDPAVSPDGRAVVFTRMTSWQGADLYLTELSADLRSVGEPKRITFGQRCTGDAAWWPDGSSILFTSGESCFDNGLWQMAIRGPARRAGEPERLRFGGEGYGPLAISRQGRMAYMQTSMVTHIWRLELNGTHRADRMPMNSTRLDHFPQYSPDGKHIAFASNRSGSHEIWLCEADGSNAVKLTSFDGPLVSSPAWAPDGRRIAFNARPGGTSEIYVVSASGGKPERLPGTQSGHGMASWSRDGKWIYFDSRRSGKDELWKVPAGGGDAVQITKEGGTYAVESPDGKSIYYVRSWGADTTELRRVPVEGGAEVRIVDSVCGQAFAGTDRGVYFFSGWKEPAVRCFRFATREVETVAKVEGNVAYGFSVSSDSRWLLYTTFEDPGAASPQSILMMVEKFR